MSRPDRNLQPILWAGIAWIGLVALSPQAGTSQAVLSDEAAVSEAVSRANPKSTVEDALALYRSASPSVRSRLREIVERGRSLGLSEELLAELLLAAHRYGADGNATAAILDHAVRVAEHDLPVQPLCDRYLQGMSKGISLTRIRTVAEEIERRLDEAARNVDTLYDRIDDPQQRRSRHLVIDHAAYAIGVGIPSEMLRRTLQLAVTDDAQIEEAGSPIVTMGLLVSGGMDMERSYEVVETGWKHGFRGEDLERLGRDLGTLGSSGEGPPPEVVEQILDQIRRMERRDQIFRDLDAMHGRIGEGYHPPGSQPGDDPTKMHGPGGPPENPGRQDDRGHHGGGSGR